MSKVLYVFLNDYCAGIYQQDKSGRKSFSYLQEYLDHSKAIPLSNSLPLKPELFGDKVCHSFFGGLLPEESQRRIVAKIYGVSASNDFSLLENIGGQCAGAISFYPTQEKDLSSHADFMPLSDKDLQDRIYHLAKYPLLLGYDEVRLSLAGVQDKIMVTENNNQLYLPLHNTPSTHIIKPEIGYIPSTVTNEHICLELAKKIGLHVVSSQIASAELTEYLLVERYDRYNNFPEITRIHQEDFCQALSIATENKYQAEGGPSLSQCIKLIRNISSNPVKDIQNLVDVVIFNYIIGNCDAHGKNFSLLYKQKNNIRLAPFYDLLSTLIYPEFSKKMSMKIGKQYKINAVTPKDFTEFAQICELNPRMVQQRIVELSAKTIKVSSEVSTYSADACSILTFIISRAEYIHLEYQNNNV